MKLLTENLLVLDWMENMPYINVDMRNDIYEEIDSVLAYIREGYGTGFLQDGDINYIITKIIMSLPHNRYQDMQKTLGLLEAVKLEYYRRVVAPYEDIKCKENGDVY